MTTHPTGSSNGPLDERADLATVLSAWQEATQRLEETHEALHAEVCRLTTELEIKNRELARQNRLADLGQMAAHVAHEVRNHLVPVKLYLSVMRRQLAGQAASLTTLGQIDVAFVALESMVADLLHFTADRDPLREPIQLSELIDDVCAGLGPQLDAQRVRVVVDAPDDLMTQGDANMIRRAILNLVLNALDVMPSGGTLWVTAWQGPQNIQLEIADSGPGLSDDARRHAFEPFFTTKANGTGLGLAIVYRIAQAHGGSVIAHNCPEGGAAFTIRLPQTDVPRATIPISAFRRAA